MDPPVTGTKNGTKFASTFICLLFVTLSVCAASNYREDSILSNYEPVAMDERLEIVRPTPKRVTSEQTSRDFEELGIMPEFSATQLSDEETDPKNSIPEPKLADVEEGGDPEKTVYGLPKNNTVALTKLITGSKTPTFLLKDLVRPDRRVSAGSKKSKLGENILATYRIVIPILIPAVKPSRDVKNASRFINVQFENVTRTEMVPMRRMVPHYREISKAERVRQNVTTDFVEVERGAIPGETNDKMKLDGRLISSVVSTLM